VLMISYTMCCADRFDGLARARNADLLLLTTVKLALRLCSAVCACCCATMFNAQRMAMSQPRELSSVAPFLRSF
jgi:hypothetical protein